MVLRAVHLLVRPGHGAAHFRSSLRDLLLREAECANCDAIVYAIAIAIVL